MKLIIALLMFSIAGFSCKQKPKTYMVYWEESDEAGKSGQVRHNGIKTKDGYLFTDTIYNHKLKKMVVHTTFVQITKVKK